MSIKQQASSISITDEQSRVKLPVALIRKLAARIAGQRTVSLAFVTDAVMRKINKRHLNHDFTTDVLSFPIGGDPWGELVICAAYAAREAKARRIPIEEELLRYVAHGLLHLLGYDDHSPRDKRRMWERQEAELRAVLPRKDTE